MRSVFLLLILSLTIQASAKVEINTAAVMLAFNRWEALDIVYFTSGSENRGYGFSLIKFSTKSTDNLREFDNQNGSSFGVNYYEEDVMSLSNSYWSVHAYAENFRRYEKDSTTKQDRRGLRATTTIGNRYQITENLICRSGVGWEFSQYKVDELDLATDTKINSYTTAGLNIFFIELKLGLNF